MLIWQVQIHQITIRSGASRWYCPARNNEIFKDLPNVFGIADNSLIVVYDANGRDHDTTFRQVMQICHQENFKWNKNKCHFKCTKMPFFEEVISREWVLLDPKKLCTLTEMPPNNKKELQSFLGIMNYLGKFLPSATEICEALQNLTSANANGPGTACIRAYVIGQKTSRRMQPWHPTMKNNSCTWRQMNWELAWE